MLAFSCERGWRTKAGNFLQLNMGRKVETSLRIWYFEVLPTFIYLVRWVPTLPQGQLGEIFLTLIQEGLLGPITLCWLKSPVLDSKLEKACSQQSPSRREKGWKHRMSISTKNSSLIAHLGLSTYSPSTVKASEFKHLQEFKFVPPPRCPKLKSFLLVPATLLGHS